MKDIVIRFGAFVFLFLMPSLASASFEEGLSGEWAGTGKAYVNNVLGEIPLRCDMSIMQNEKSLRMKGICRFGLIRRVIQVSISRNEDGLYSGTYSGKRTRFARLSGTNSGPELSMSIDWLRPVFGDRSAHFYMKRTGPDGFLQTFRDVIKGKQRETSRFIFVRKRAGS